MAVTQAEGLSLRVIGCRPAPGFELTDDDQQRFSTQPEGAAQKCLQATCQQSLTGALCSPQHKDSHLACG